MKNYPLYIIVALAASLAVTFLLVLPKNDSLTALNKQILEKQVELTSEENYVAKLKETYAAVTAKKDALDKVDSALPTKHSLPELLNFFQKAAAQSGLLLEEVIPAASDKADNIREFNTSLILKGSYSSFKEFISLLETSARLIDANSIKFSRAQKIGGTGENIFEFELNTRVHSY